MSHTFQSLGSVAARVVHQINPRRNRDFERGRRAAAQARRTGESAMDAALAQIGATFNHAAAVNNLKMRVEHFIRLGADHPAVRARYGRRAGMLRGYSIDGAIILVNRWHRDERKAFQIASALGRGTRLSLDVLAELRLALRLGRRKLSDQQFRIIVAGVLGADAIAAG